MSELFSNKIKLINIYLYLVFISLPINSLFSAAIKPSEKSKMYSWTLLSEDQREFELNICKIINKTDINYSLRATFFDENNNPYIAEADIYSNSEYHLNIANNHRLLSLIVIGIKSIEYNAVQSIILKDFFVIQHSRSRVVLFIDPKQSKEALQYSAPPGAILPLL